MIVDINVVSFMDLNVPSSHMVTSGQDIIVACCVHKLTPPPSPFLSVSTVGSGFDPCVILTEIYPPNVYDYFYTPSLTPAPSLLVLVGVKRSE